MANENGLSNVRIEYSNEATVNTGNFQNVKPGFSVSADVADGVHPTEAKKRLVSLVDAWLEEEVAAIQADLAS
jgi:hypothetical protein